MAHPRPRVTSIVETITPGGALASITLQVELADLEDVLAACDASTVQGAGLDKIRDSAAALAKIREVEVSSGAPPADVAAGTPEPELDDEPPALPPAPAAKTGQDLVDHLVAKETSS